MDRLNWEEMRGLVVQRVIERGRMNDFYAILNLYSLDGVKEAIKGIAYLNTKDLSFVCSVFNLKKEDLKCYIKQQSTVRHWGETIKGEIDGVQLDCIAHQYPWISSHYREENIRFASFDDIAAMKLNAIAGDGTRIKDFIDIAYLSDKIPLNKMLKGYEMKYNANPVITVKAIAYFDDINFNEPIKMSDGSKVNWAKIETRLKDMLNYPDRIFKALT